MKFQKVAGNRKRVKRQNTGLHRLPPLEPLTKNQEIVIDQFLKGNNMIVHGSAGTGKTFLALYLSLMELLGDKMYRNIKIIRSIVPSRDIGFLPGTIEEKSAVYESVYIDLVNRIFERGDAYHSLKNKGMIEFHTTSFLRGTTFEDSLIILDEVQNFSDNEIVACITRLGSNCRLMVCGDTAQFDFQKDKDKEGMFRLLKVADKMPSLKVVKMTPEDIVRDDIVRDFIIARENLNFT